METRKKNLSTYFEFVNLGVISLLLVLLPLFFLAETTDAFMLPKQLLVIAVATLGLLVFLVKTMFRRRLILRVSPFDLPVGLLMIVFVVSAALSINKADALTTVTPIFFLGVLYFVIVNSVKNEKQLFFLLSSLTLGAVISALMAILTFLKIYPLPFQYSHVTNFTTFGALLDQALYYALVLPIAGYFGYGYLVGQKKNAPDSLANAAEGQAVSKSSRKTLAAFAGSFLVLLIGLGLSVFMLMTTQKPLILTFDIGLQTAMASLSQSAPNIFQNIFFGSGFGTYLSDFTRFKAASYNLNESLWAFTFFRSSSWFFELMATTGLLGVGAFGLLVYRILRQKTPFLPLILALVAALVLPFSFTMIALFFILVAMFAVVTSHNNPNKYGDNQVRFVPLSKGLIRLSHSRTIAESNLPDKKANSIFPFAFTVLVVLLLAFPLYFTVRYALSDLTFQRSLIAASQNDGVKTYELQAASITIFPYRDIYYRAFSQTNLALANSLASNQPKDKKPDENAQKNVLTLIQQSINAGRTSVAIAPLTSFNWNNLSTIYRSLIGFGENADKFTFLTLNQAIALDSNNPQQYIELGGVYYQLGKFDEAIKQFETAVNLKKNYANAYYNLGHAYEEKGQFDQAKQLYQTVKELVSDNAENTKKINEDIQMLEKKKAGQEAAQQQQANTQVQQSPEVIDVNKSEKQLPERNPKEKIPGPTVSPAQATVAEPTTSQ